MPRSHLLDRRASRARRRALSASGTPRETTRKVHRRRLLDGVDDLGGNPLFVALEHHLRVVKPAFSPLAHPRDLLVEVGRIALRRAT